MANPLTIFRRNEASPFRSLSRLQNEFDRLFHDLMESSPPASEQFSFSPSCELSEDKGNYILKFDMPGVKKEDVKIEMDNNQLTVFAERREEKKADEKKSRYSEISYGVYQRSFALPSNVDEKKVDAKFEDGVLMVMLPKSEVSKAKQISVH